MKMEKSSEDQMGCSMCFSIAVLAIPLLIFAGFRGFGFMSILLITSSVLILSTVVLSSFKNKPRLVESEEEDHMEHVVSKPQPESDQATTQQNNEAQESHEVGDEFLVDTSSECESCLDQSSTSEDSEADHSPDWSDGSISDEESLIEIALPSGHYVGHNYKKEEPKYMNLQPKMLPDFLELLAEINEMNELEDNLIEIDISMGSIKCSRIEIEA